MVDASCTESRNYWRAARMLAAERRSATPDQDAIEDALSELEAIVLYTNQRALRAACRKLIAEATEQPTAAAVLL